MRRVFTLIVLAGLSIPRLGAVVHPTLDPKADTPRCLECHADKAKGKKVVHAPMAQGCLTCHEVRVTGNVTRVKLTTTNPRSLCITCHSDKDTTTLKGKIHNPEARDCLKCHDPHHADQKGLLVKAVAGPTAQENLCLTCHNTGANVPAGGSRHAALDQGCETCHQAHKVGDAAQREFADHLVKDSPALCVTCHDLKNAAMVKAHPNQAAGADCLKCHDPHASASPKLLLVAAAAPAKVEPIITQVTAEHPYIDPKQIKTETCIKCHPNKAQGKFVHTAVAQGCENCHTAASENNKTTITDVAVGGDLCAMCHEAAKATVQHAPYKNGQCLVCHDPHTGDFPKQTRAAVNQLCLTCHGPADERPQANGDQLVVLFGGKVKLPEAYYQQVPILPLHDGVGHPLQGHPVSTVIDPNTKAQVAMDCLSCHQPHAGNSPRMLVKDQKDDMAFCNTCHNSGTDKLGVRAGGKKDVPEKKSQK